MIYDKFEYAEHIFWQFLIWMYNIGLFQSWAGFIQVLVKPHQFSMSFNVVVVNILHPKSILAIDNQQCELNFEVSFSTLWELMRHV